MNKHLQLLTFLALLLLGQTSFAQNILKGTIKDKNGKPIPDAIIAVKGTKFNTSTDTTLSFRLPMEMNDLGMTGKTLDEGKRIE